MNAADAATEVLLSQEIESLAGCVARDQPPDTYQDIVEKVRGHASKLPADRRDFWSEQVQSLGVTLFPVEAQPKKGRGTTYADRDREQTTKESRS
jgi:hypothetical protein